MKEATVVFPHQLFKSHPGLSRNRTVYLVEDPFLFSVLQKGIKQHKKKIVLHRASMMGFKDRLESDNYHIRYLAYQDESGCKVLFDRLRKDGIEKIHMVDVCDAGIEKEIGRRAEGWHGGISLLSSPGFLTDPEWITEFFRNVKHYSQLRFYIAQRKRLKILVEEGKPAGGRWSFDPANRKRIPENLKIPSLPSPGKNRHVEEAEKHVDANFPDHPGETEGFMFPATHEEAVAWLDDFLQKRLALFGDYEDAISQKEAFLFHSVLTPVLNIGLLEPREIIERTLDFSKENPVSLNSLEGFIRQIIGWREFMRAVYLLDGGRQRESNFWNHTRRIPDSFYAAETGILPVDAVIGRLHELAYVHHIERLMVLGNFMLLCEIDPAEVYRWFMEMFIDAYDWVMIPNVFGMSQYADGGLITTKPYISSSNYLRKMSDFPKGKWCGVWDGLYWRFIHEHRDFFSENPRLKMMVFQLEKMEKEKRDRHLNAAEEFLDTLEA